MINILIEIKLNSYNLNLYSKHHAQIINSYIKMFLHSVSLENLNVNNRFPDI